MLTEVVHERCMLGEQEIWQVRFLYQASFSSNYAADVNQILDHCARIPD
jgi:hypothetical protein